MKISCIIPTCDRPELLKEAVRSVLKQTVLPDEILIINNGAKKIEMQYDWPANLVKIHAADPYIGVARARNLGADLANGEYLAFLDDDDLWSKNYLENVTVAIGEGAVCIVSRLDKLMDGKISAFKNADGKITLKRLLVSNPGITGTNVVISKKNFQDLGGYHADLPPSEDKSLIIETLLKGVPIRTLPDNQAIIREHSGGRLTNPAKMAKGVYYFTKRYRHLMTTCEYLYNWKKFIGLKLKAICGY